MPADSNFGRVGGRLSTGDPATRDILCTNPAALGGGPGTLKTIFPSERFAPGSTIGTATEAVGIPRPAVSTTWIEAKGAYSGVCDSSDDADVLEISPAQWRPGAQRGARRGLGPAPDRRQHRARQRARRREQADPRLREGEPLAQITGGAGSGGSGGPGSGTGGAGGPGSGNGGEGEGAGGPGVSKVIDGSSTRWNSDNSPVPAIVKQKPECRHCGAVLSHTLSKCPRCGKRSWANLFLGGLGRRY